MQGQILEEERFNVLDKQGKMRKKLKVYSVRYRYTDPETGKRKRTTKRGFLTKADAEAFLLEIILFNSSVLKSYIKHIFIYKYVNKNHQKK